MRLPQSQRKCLLDDEKRLDIKNKYSYNACMLDCQVENIVKRCKCMPFMYPYKRKVEQHFVNESSINQVFEFFSSPFRC